MTTTTTSQQHRQQQNNVRVVASSPSSSSPPLPQQQQTSSSDIQSNNNNNWFGMVVVLGMVATSAGFTLYTKRTSTMLKQMDQISKKKARRMPPPKIGPLTKSEWDKVRPRIDDKDDFV